MTRHGFLSLTACVVAHSEDGPVDYTIRISEIDLVAGEFKDVVGVPAHQTVEVDLGANHSGLSQFQCHRQFHMDFRFTAVMEY